MQIVRDKKLARLASGAAPRVLELCSGSGGLALGLKTGGFELSAHVEIDAEAAATYAKNFAPPSEQCRQQWSMPRDMTSCTAEVLCADLGLSGPVEEAFDVLAAGLPCQAFARIGRSKLRSVAGDDAAYKNDPRATLYHRFLQYVRATRPLAIVIENVPDILNFGGHNVPEEISATLDDLGYRTAYTLLNAAFYGVPQIRERLILIGIDASLDTPPGFPIPTHRIKLPTGYEGSRTVALKHVPQDGHFIPIQEPSRNLPRAVAVREALGDLPFISEHFRDPGIVRRRKVTDSLEYRTVQPLTAYARHMRNWMGFETKGTVDGHVVRLTPRDFPIFAQMPHGADYPTAVTVAHALFDAKLTVTANRLGHAPGTRSSLYKKLWRETVPPYDSSKFPNKWWKLIPTAPSRTLTAHIGKDTYSHIHHDSRQKRTISVREAARLQSFPDGFQFVGEMNAAFRQIGNAVPPLLALAVARVLREQLINGAITFSSQRPSSHRSARTRASRTRASRPGA